jgi:rSAM/selenodomain-associated transferase 1
VSSTFIVFAKAPLAGQAKTRLVPALGAEGAAALAARLLAHAVQQAAAAAAALGAGLQLCVTPDIHDPLFAPLVQRYGLILTTQGSGDLGERMHRALTLALAQADRALLMGTDAPALDSALLLQANQALDQADAVFVPALDGGYALVGLRAPAPALFSSMVWSTAAVMQDTRVRARQAGLRLVELAPVPDIDVPQDLAHLPQGWL